MHQTTCLLLLAGWLSTASCARFHGWADHRLSQTQQQVASKPPMGFNTWNAFHTRISEDIIRQTADLMVALGLVDAGYTYLNIDDAWSNLVRGPNHELQSHPERFPSGIPKLVQYAEQRGLKLGLYTDAGALTCAGYPGSLGFETIDAETFATWGVSYLKVDNCWADQATVVQRYAAMGKALHEKTSPSSSLLYSICSWGVGAPWLGWGRKVGGHVWRTSRDIRPEWASILRCLDSVKGLSRYAGPGGWNDPDMLEVGNGNLTFGQQKAHFALWALTKAPLLIGTDLRKLSTPAGMQSLAILLSREVIAINQDDLAVAGDLVWSDGVAQIWACPLMGGARAVVVLNRCDDANARDRQVNIQWSMIGYPRDVQVAIRDLYTLANVAAAAAGSYSVSVPSGDCLALKLTPIGVIDERWDEWRPWIQPQADTSTF